MNTFIRHKSANRLTIYSPDKLVATRNRVGQLTSSDFVTSQVVDRSNKIITAKTVRLKIAKITGVKFSP
jgi:hypothetical protein